MDGSSFIATTEPVDGLRASAIARPQKAFAVAFAVLATALAGCASGLGANAADRGSVATVARVEEGTVVGVRPIPIEGSSQGVKVGAGSKSYTIRLRSGELVSVAQAGARAIPTGAPVLIEYGQRARVIPQNSSIGYN